MEKALTDSTKDAKLENLKNNSSDKSSVEKNKHGGARQNAGRPLGKMNEDTKIRRDAKQKYLERIAKDADKLYRAQFTLAVGVPLLFKIKKDKKGNPLPAKQVMKEAEIENFFNEFGGEPTGVTDDGTYYFIAAQRPDNKAIKDMLDRTFGKPDEHIDLTSGGREIEQPKVISIINARKGK